MDLIYMNSALEDIGVLNEYDLDLAFGADENDFECKILSSAHCCQPGWYLYIENTEYGGIIDSIEVDTGSNNLTYKGRTWHGMLDSKILQPDNGEDYLTVSGEANEVLASLLSRIGLSGLFVAASVPSGININSYKMNRYVTAYNGITKMLDGVGAKLRLVFQNGKVVISAVMKRKADQDDEIDSDQVDFVMEKKYKCVNHLVCLGKGELAKRTVIHLYTDENGNVSQTQTFFGIDEYMQVFDYPSAETDEELINSGTERLKELQKASEVSVDCDESEDTFDVGDVVSAYDNVTGMSVSAVIEKKVVSVVNGKISIVLTPGMNKSSGSSGTSGGESGGGNGAGSVATVNGVSPDEYGNIQLDVVNKQYVDKRDWFNAGTSIPNNSDLDTYRTPGKYYCNSGDGSATIINSPFYQTGIKSNFVLYVLTRTSGASIAQLIISMDYGWYFRHCNSSGTLRPWRRLVDTDNVGAIVKDAGFVLNTDIADVVRTAEDITAALGYTPGKGCAFNILDNSDFTNPVNQRGETSYKGAVYGIDRWKCTSANWMLTVDDGCITVSDNPDSTNTSTAMIQQVIEVPTTLIGKTVTLAAKLKGSDVRLNINNKVTGPYAGQDDWYIKVSTWVVPEGTETMFVALQSRNMVTYSCEWVALYEGEYTVETLPNYQPKGYAVELLECQRHYVSFGDMIFRSSISESPIHNITILFPVPMRILPTINATAIEGEMPSPNVSKNGVAFSVYGEKYTLQYLTASADL